MTEDMVISLRLLRDLCASAVNQVSQQARCCCSVLYHTMMRVLLLNNVPAPYFNPLFEKLGRESGWQLTVCYSSSWNRDVGWEEEKLEARDANQTIILDQRTRGLGKRLGSSSAAATALVQILLRERPDYLICYGYTLKPQTTALLWAMLTRTPFAVVGDANIYCDTAGGMKRVFKRWWLRQVTRRAAALITIGQANRMFWESYGARTEQLFEARFAVDNEYYAQASEARKAESVALRAKLGLTDKVVFLFVGRLLKRKNVDLIIRAVQRLKDHYVALVIAGTGEERDSLKALADGDPRVIFAGAVEPDELPLYYATADVIVLPASQEPWGLVINEAMACGLAVISHRDCGATLDLVGVDNGISLESFSVDELARAMKLIAGDDALRHSMQLRSREKIKPWSIEGAAQGIKMAVESSVKKRPARLNESTEDWYKSTTD
ncbi:MAG: glycosyltransferase family 4 protein [Acidobacteria bacterium]|nr:glycosyltransferase family 4 protein [Acidobacteriota bacterium]